MSLSKIFLLCKVLIHTVKRYKMNELKLPTNLETITLYQQTNCTLNEINKTKNYFECEMKEQKVIIKKLSKYITCFDYTDKILSVCLTILSGVNIFPHIKAKKHTGLISSVFSLFLYLSVRIIKKLLYETKKERKNTIKYFI